MNEYNLGDTDQLEKRTEALKCFLTLMFDADERPWFVADDATIYDIYIGSDAEFVERCKNAYGVAIAAADFRRPVWQILDKLGQPVEREHR